jgi:hypothetical protein
MSDLDHVPPFNQRGPLPPLFPAAVLRLCLCYGFFNLRDEFFNCVCRCVRNGRDYVPYDLQRFLNAVYGFFR